VTLGLAFALGIKGVAWLHVEALTTIAGSDWAAPAAFVPGPPRTGPPVPTAVRPAVGAPPATIMHRVGAKPYAHASAWSGGLAGVRCVAVRDPPGRGPGTSYPRVEMAAFPG